VADLQGFFIEKMKQKSGPIVILGGMGPDASSELVAKIIKQSREVGGAKNSDDYPDFIMRNIPVPDFFDNPLLYKKGLRILIKSVKELEKLKPRYFALACNTVHSVIPELSKVTNIPFLNLPEIIAEKLEKENINNVGLLATPFTYQSGIYKRALAERKIKLITPEKPDQNRLGRIVHSVLAGDFETTPKKLMEIYQNLVDKGAKAIILGCTELPLIFPTNYNSTVISSLDFLAEEIVRSYYGTKNI
jgi:aspartate racemase